ncbi:UDP-glucose--hexose-1-phosphate uridylyltransferase, partial [Pediococcus acidilactici]|nr:UDP-glucose--hexose-1-phosphate uridylyltransferase [Pediococcus acidilactici]
MNSLEQFVQAVIDSTSQYTNLDHIYVYNRVLGLVGEGEPAEAVDGQLTSLVDALVKTAIQNGKIEDTQSDKSILADQLMDLVTPLPSVLNQLFWDKYQVSPKAATDYFFKLSKDNDYIKTRAIAKNVSFPAKTDFGQLEITINLSKPEKDPKAIAA